MEHNLFLGRKFLFVFQKGFDLVAHGGRRPLDILPIDLDHEILKSLGAQQPDRGQNDLHAGLDQIGPVLERLRIAFAHDEDDR